MNLTLKRGLPRYLHKEIAVICKFFKFALAALTPVIFTIPASADPFEASDVLCQTVNKHNCVYLSSGEVKTGQTQNMRMSDFLAELSQEIGLPICIENLYEINDWSPADVNADTLVPFDRGFAIVYGC